MIDGRDFDPAEPRTNWGYSDKALMHAAVRAFDRLEEPFAAMALTVSNHHPFQVPADASTSFEPPEIGARRLRDRARPLAEVLGLHTGPMLKTIHYTDEAVGSILRPRASPPWYRTDDLRDLRRPRPSDRASLDGTPTPHRFASLRHQRSRSSSFLRSSRGGSRSKVPRRSRTSRRRFSGSSASRAERRRREGISSHRSRRAGRSSRGTTRAAPSRPRRAGYVYHATLAPEGGGSLGATRREPVRGGRRRGRDDLAQREPEAVARFRASVLAWAGAKP